MKLFLSLSQKKQILIKLTSSGSKNFVFQIFFTAKMDIQEILKILHWSSKINWFAISHSRFEASHHSVLHSILEKSLQQVVSDINYEKGICQMQLCFAIQLILGK